MAEGSEGKERKLSGSNAPALYSTTRSRSMISYSGQAAAHSYAKHLTHVFHIVNQQLEAGLFVVKRVAAFLMLISNASDDFAGKIDSAVISERERFPTQWSRDSMAGVLKLSGVELTNLMFSEFTNKHRVFSLNVKVSVVEPLELFYQRAEPLRKKLMEDYEHTTSEIRDLRADIMKERATCIRLWDKMIEIKNEIDGERKHFMSVSSRSQLRGATQRSEKKLSRAREKVLKQFTLFENLCDRSVKSLRSAHHVKIPSFLAQAEELEIERISVLRKHINIFSHLNKALMSPMSATDDFHSLARDLSVQGEMTFAVAQWLHDHGRPSPVPPLVTGLPCPSSDLISNAWENVPGNWQTLSQQAISISPPQASDSSTMELHQEFVHVIAHDAADPRRPPRRIDSSNNGDKNDNNNGTDKHDDNGDENDNIPVPATLPPAPLPPSRNIPGCVVQHKANRVVTGNESATDMHILPRIPAQQRVAKRITRCWVRATADYDCNDPGAPFFFKTGDFLRVYRFDDDDGHNDEDERVLSEKNESEGNQVIAGLVVSDDSENKGRVSYGGIASVVESKSDIEWMSSRIRGDTVRMRREDWTALFAQTLPRDGVDDNDSKRDVLAKEHLVSTCNNASDNASEECVCWWVGEVVRAVGFSRGTGLPRGPGYFPSSLVSVIADDWMVMALVNEFDRQQMPKKMQLLVDFEYAPTEEEDAEEDLEMNLRLQCLSLRAGDIVSVVQRDDNEWWVGEIDGVTGYFPRSKCKSILRRPAKQSEAEFSSVFYDTSSPECSDNARTSSSSSFAAAPPRVTTLADVIRGKVSQKKRRFQADGYDLDLTYITKNIIAMGYPAEGTEGFYRNNIREVQRFFNSRHPDAYKLYNLCSERAYDPFAFEGRVARYPFDDHNPCEFDYIEPFCMDVQSWLNRNPKNIAAIHCKAGKGRTGFLISCYMLFSKMKLHAASALRAFAEKRTSDGNGVSIPSQIRYTHYFDHFLKHRKQVPQSHPLYLHSIVICAPPAAILSSRVFVWFEIENRQPNSHGDIKYKSKGLIEPVVSPRDDRVGWVTRSLTSIPPLDGDVKVLVWHTSTFGKEKLFQFWFNTRFLVPLSSGTNEAEVQQTQCARPRRAVTTTADSTMDSTADLTATSVNSNSVRNGGSNGGGESDEGRQMRDKFSNRKRYCLFFPKTQLDKACKDTKHQTTRSDISVEITLYDQKLLPTPPPLPLAVI